ncbi:TetR/AcrR family transcriptional regulator [Hamadaea tsunoensis]|uniref:TetR/AcrR family transcriptional regulator n=1 Tax=Hamadaea tsunoensis TaxID=53368 RepID=UPI000487D052|nr:TetR/AcrR family transcriptional regulator [Hamadaea tsunoensis]
MIAEGRRRADAERSIAAILDAAVERFGQSPDASMTDIARAAGVGRVTLYGHFASREQLLHAAAVHLVTRAKTAFDGLDLDTLPADAALEAMLRASWRLIEQHRAFFVTVMRGEHADVAGHHDLIFRQVGDVIARGRTAGVFRSDQPVSWLVAVCVGLTHAAAAHSAAGELPADQAVENLVATVRAALRPD